MWADKSSCLRASTRIIVGRYNYRSGGAANGVRVALDVALRLDQADAVAADHRQEWRCLIINEEVKLIRADLLLAMARRLRFVACSGLDLLRTLHVGPNPTLKP